MASSTITPSSLSFPASAIASSTIFHIPELVEAFGRHLKHIDLLSCVQVCRFWKQVFTPHLWRVLDDNTEPWHTMAQKIKAIPENEYERLQTYLCTVKRRAAYFFETYGHHIQIFDHGWYVLHEAASLPKSKCTNLVSLNIYNPWGFHQTPPIIPTTEDENDFILTVQKHWQPPLDLIFDFYGSRILVLRHEADRFWLLVHRNPSLVQLTLPSMGGMRYFTSEFFTSIFSRLKHLQVLNTQENRFDTNLILRTLPRLERLQGVWLRRLDNLEKVFTNLHCLCFYNESIEISGFVRTLKHLSSLEWLHLYRFRLGESTPTLEAAQQMVASTEPFSRLKTFIIECRTQYLNSHIHGTLQTHDKLNALAVGLFPGLTQFKIEMLSPEVKEALWKHCYNLELIDAANEEDCVAIHAWMERRRQDARLVDN